MFDDIFGRKKRAAEKAEANLKERLALSISRYNAAQDSTESEFTEVDFGEGRRRVKKQQIDIEDVWASNPADTSRWHRENIK